MGTVLEFRLPLLLSSRKEQHEAQPWYWDGELSLYRSDFLLLRQDTSQLQFKGREAYFGWQFSEDLVHGCLVPCQKTPAGKVWCGSEMLLNPRQPGSRERVARVKISLFRVALPSESKSAQNSPVHTDENCAAITVTFQTYDMFGRQSRYKPRQTCSWKLAKYPVRISDTIILFL